MRPSVLVVAILAAAFSSAAFPQSNDEIARRLIAQSIANYPGPCPCPYNTMRNGRSCGGRSAYSKPGGYAPLCYREDVTDEMIRQYRKQRRE